MHHGTRRFAVPGSAVVVIDVQNDFCDAQGSLAQAGNDVRGVVAMVPRLATFLDGARSAGVPVLFVRTTHDDETDTPAWAGRRQLDGVPAGARSATCRTGSWGCEFYGVEPAADEPVWTKHRYSTFTNPTFDADLRKAGITSLFFTGVVTDACVETSLRDALCRDYHVTLVTDCCAAYDQGAHDATVRAVRTHFGPALSADETLRAWAEARRAALTPELSDL